MRKNLLALGVAAALYGLSGSAMSAVTLGDIGLPATSDPYDFQMKYNNYEVLTGDTAFDSGLSNTDGLYLGDSFGIFRVSVIETLGGFELLWAPQGVTGSTVLQLTGLFWGFDVFKVEDETAFAVGGSIALFANPLWNALILEQGPAAMVTTGSTTISGVDLPTYAGITDGELILIGDYTAGCSVANPTATLCAPSFTEVIDGIFKGAAFGYVNVNPTIGLGSYFQTAGLETDQPGVFADLKTNSNFDTNAAQGFPDSNWPIYSFDPVIGAVQAVPEPATLALIGLGLFGLGAVSRRRRAA